MAAHDMDTETAFSTVNDRIANSDLKETYFMSRLALEKATPDDDDYTVDLLETTDERLREVLVDFLNFSETALDADYEVWKMNK